MSDARPANFNLQLFDLRNRRVSCPPDSIPWAAAEPAYEAYAKRFGREQTMERIHERAGFSTGEMDFLDPEWRSRLPDDHPIKRWQPW